jgi:hypothetical protein
MLIRLVEIAVLLYVVQNGLECAPDAYLSNKWSSGIYVCMYVNSETLSLLASGSFSPASHIQTRDCRIIVDISSILIKLSCIFILKLLCGFKICILFYDYTCVAV